MKNLFVLLTFLTISTAASSQALTYVKSLCENKATSWMDKLGLTYKGDLTVSDVEESGNNKIKVKGTFRYYSGNCGSTSCTFEAELKKILDELEVTSMCRYAPFCAMGIEYKREYRCFPN